MLRRWDDDAFGAVNRFAVHTAWLHGPALAYARLGVIAFALLLVAGLVVARHSVSRNLAAAGWAAIATLLAVAVNQPIGRRVSEARPYVRHPHALRLADVTTDFSFPSDHAVMAGAVAAGLLLVDRRIGAVAAVLALLMAFARVYIAAHYPWDVVAGLGLGALVAWVGWLLLCLPLTAFTAWSRRRAGLRIVFGEA